MNQSSGGQLAVRPGDWDGILTLGARRQDPGAALCYDVRNLEGQVALAASKAPISHEEYLAGEKTSAVKHEYVAGEVFAMSGASLAHSRITMNLSLLIAPHLKGGPCRAWASDVKLRVEAADAFYYPDFMVTCQPSDHVPGYIVRAPSLIIEVLSPSTQDFDRGRKFQDYQSLDSLKDYVLIHQDQVRVEHFTRQGPDRWNLEILGPGKSLELASIDFSCAVDDLYEDVEWEVPREGVAPTLPSPQVS